MSWGINKNTVFRIIILLAIAFFYILNNFIWLQHDANPHGIGYDLDLINAIHYQKNIYDIKRSSDDLIKKIVDVHGLLRARPGDDEGRLLYLMAGFIKPGRSFLFDVRFYTNLPFFFLLVFGTYLYAKKLFDVRTGLLAAFLVSSYPMVYAYSRQFMQDFPLIGVSVFCLGLLAYTKHYSKRWLTLLLGFLGSLSTLVKPQVLLYLMPPVVFIFFEAFKQPETERNQSLLNFFMAATISSMICFFYWAGFGFKSMLISIDRDWFSLYPLHAKGNYHPIGVVEMPVFSMASLVFYPRQLLIFMSWPFFVIFLYSIIEMFRSRMKNKSFLAVCFFVPGMILTFMSVKYAKYVLPLMPVAAVMSAWVIQSINKCFIRRIALIGVIGYSLVLFFYFSWHGQYGDVRSLLTLPLDEGVSLSSPYVSAPAAIDSYEKLNVTKRLQDRLESGEPVTVCFASDSKSAYVAVFGLFYKYIFSEKLDMQYRDQDFDVRFLFDDGPAKEPDYVFIDYEAFYSSERLSKQYQVLDVFPHEKIYILEKNGQGVKLD